MHTNDVANSVDPDGVLYLGTSNLGITVCLSHIYDIIIKPRHVISNKVAF